MKTGGFTNKGNMWRKYNEDVNKENDEIMIEKDKIVLVKNEVMHIIE